MKIDARHLFDIPEGITYLNAGSISAQLKSVTEAGIIGLQRKIHPWEITTADWFDNAEVLRALVAQVINADAEGMAIIPSASYGISIAANNIPVGKGQQIVIVEHEYPSNYYAWAELAKRNEAAVVTVKKENRTWTEAIVDAITDKTALVTVANCHWTNGALIDLAQVSKKAKSVGAALIIDASQSLGVYPLDIATIQPDFLVSVGYKWLLGPYGLGYLYAAPKWRTQGKPIEFSWLTKNEAENFAGLVNYRDDYRPGARRFDMGEFPGFINVPMAIAGVKQILEWGVENIQTNLREITQLIAEKAAALSLQFPAENERVDHMIGLDLPNGIPDALKEALKKENVFVGFRGASIRVAPYLYTNQKDISKLFAIIQKYV